MSFSHKKGYPIQFDLKSKAMQYMLESNASWTHNWDDHIDIEIQKSLNSHNISFCPSLWNDKYKYRGGNYIKKPKFVLGFNEPDKKSQSNMSIKDAIHAWTFLSKTIPEDVILVGPACSDDVHGHAWAREFYRKALDMKLRIDAIGLHLYRDDLYGYGKNFIPRISDEFQLPVVISEFAYINWNSRIQDWKCKNFLNKAINESLRFINWCEDDQAVQGYCIFADYNDHLPIRDDYKYAWKMISQGYLTELYKHYRQI